MKKVASVLMRLLFILIILYPACILTASCFGYGFELINISAFAVVIAVLSVSVVVGDFIYNNTLEKKGLRILSAVIAPLSLINAVLCIFALPKIPVITGVLISVICCFYLTAKYGKPTVLKKITLTLSGLTILPIGFISFVLLFFGNIGQNTVVQAVESPSGKYYAQVIDSDQGALGGDTFVDVYEKNGIRTVIFKMEKKPQRVYSGDWGEFDDMQIYWKDDERLILNSTEYKIK